MSLQYKIYTDFTIPGADPWIFTLVGSGLSDDITTRQTNMCTSQWGIKATTRFALTNFGIFQNQVNESWNIKWQLVVYHFELTLFSSNLSSSLILDSFSFINACFSLVLAWMATFCRSRSSLAVNGEQVNVLNCRNCHTKMGRFHYVIHVTLTGLLWGSLSWLSSLWTLVWILFQVGSLRTVRIWLYTLPDYILKMLSKSR